MITGLLGGIGIFLLGMALLTDGLKAIAGDRLRMLLARITGRPIAAFLTGAGLTAVVQSSSATTVATIGLVSAGLLQLENAVGIIFGANIGTTSTGWIVALLGLKLDIGKLALPIVAFGVLVKLVSRDRRASIGLALAGFGLIFVGIDMLKLAMKELATKIDPAAIPGETMLGALLLVAVGMVMTVLMQSSSAAVATTLTAMHAGTIGLEQAAYLVIGQNVGTTVTAVIGAVGATSAARRTAAAHVVFNIGTGLVALGFVPLFVRGIPHLIDDAGRSVLSLAAFHTAFNVIGVAIFMPLRRPLARGLSRLIGRDEPDLTVHLDRAVAAIPAVGIDAARRTVKQVVAEVGQTLRDVIESEHAARRLGPRLDLARAALDEVRDFLERIRTAPTAKEHAMHLGVIHAIDHVTRMIEAAGEGRPAEVIRKSGDLAEPAAVFGAAIDSLSPWLTNAVHVERPEEIAERASRTIVELRRRHRVEVMRRTAAGEVPSGSALHRLESMRWLDRLAYHVWRAVHHLQLPELKSVEDPAKVSSEVAIDPEPGDRTATERGSSVS